MCLGWVVDKEDLQWLVQDVGEINLHQFKKNLFEELLYQLFSWGTPENLVLLIQLCMHIDGKLEELQQGMGGRKGHH